MIHAYKRIYFSINLQTLCTIDDENDNNNDNDNDNDNDNNDADNEKSDDFPLEIFDPHLCQISTFKNRAKKKGKK